MLSKIQNIINSIQSSKVVEVLDAVRRKQRIYNSEMQIGDDLVKITDGSHIQMKNERLYIKEVKLMIAGEYFVISFDNGEFIHYDYYGKAYVSLDEESKLYKLRLSRYDITKII